jgi:hypothetical protein
MTFKLWDRWAPSLGILTVVCWALAFAVGGSNPSTDDSDSQITSRPSLSVPSSSGRRPHWPCGRPSYLAGSAGWGCSSA